MSNEFTIQTPDFYKAIYKNKSYQLETIQLLNALSLKLDPPWNVLEVGAGAGQLINLIYPFSHTYTAIEPSKLMFDGLIKFLQKNNQFNVSAHNLSFQNYIKEFSKLNFDILIANFNVFNYLEYDELLNTIKKIKKLNKNKKIIAFDTWSLSYVLKREKEMKSKVSFSLRQNNEDILIQRISNSFFDIEKNKLLIDFKFIQRSPISKFLGEENHIIYPIDINKIKNDLNSVSNNVSVTPFPLKNNDNKDYDNYRNWLITILID